jgi:hypothetical protein
MRPRLWLDDEDGRFGNGFAPDGMEEEEDVGFADAVPQLRVCDTDERDDCAVEFLSFSTRVDFGAVLAFVADPDDVALAHPPGNAELDGAGPGSDG